MTEENKQQRHFVRLKVILEEKFEETWLERNKRKCNDVINKEINGGRYCNLQVY